MTYALIDNATLTAVQRISGEIETKSSDSVDTDIVALENLVQAILFYDQVVAIDNYIPEFREERIQRFPFVKFLREEDFQFDAIGESANEIASKIQPKIRGGEFANDDFRELMELLKTHIVCTWDISSSIYFLTLKGLAREGSAEFKKYGNLAASIFSELNDAEEVGERSSAKVELIDRYGNPIRKGYKVPGAKWGDGSTGGATGAIYAFVAALVWLANRSIFYSLSARYLQADSFLYPIRQAYQQHYIAQTCGYDQDFPKHVVNTFSKALSRDVIDLHKGGLATSTAIDLPILSAWIARQTGDASQIVSAAIQLRDAQEFIEAREQMRQLRNAFDDDDIARANKEVAKISKQIGNISSDIRAKYGIQTRQGVPVTRLVQIYNSVAAIKGLPALPDFDFKVPLPGFIRDLKAPSGFSAIYRNISDDLSAVWALGDARDILGAKVKKDDKAVAYNPKSEAPEYRNAHSPFKSPM